MKLDPKKTLYLIDGSSILYRGYYGVRPLHTSQGEPVHAAYNFFRVIKKLADRFSPEYIALVWDSKGKTIRHEMYEQYKGGRQAPPSDLFTQKDRIVEFANLIDLQQIEIPGYEADDLMYSIAQDWVKKGGTAVFVTSDKDMGQALSDTVIIYDPAKDELIDTQAFQTKMGFSVDRLPLYFALLGDASDNIPGVRGIGKKGATDLAKQFSSLKELYDGLAAIQSPRIQKALTESKDKAFLSHELFLLQYYPTELTASDLSFDVGKWPNARPIFEQLEFKSLLKELGTATITAEEKIEQIKERGYIFKTVTTLQQLNEMVVYLKDKQRFALDTETNGIRPLQCSLVGLSFCAEKGLAYYVPCGHKNGEQLSAEYVCATLRPLLEDEAYEKYLHNSKFDQLVLAHHGIELQGITFDTLIAASLVTKEWQRNSLKAISVYYFQEHMLTFEDVVKTPKLKNFAYVDLQTATYYAANDAHQTLRLVEPLQKEIKQEKMEKLYYELEFPLIQVLYLMEKKGIHVDVHALKQLDEQVTHEITDIEKQIKALLGDPERAINLNSPKQLQKLLFEELGLPPQRKSIKGGYSTDQEVLLILAKEHPIPALLVKYRELFKLKSTYLDALPRYVNPHDGRIHTTFSQTRAETGRLASFDPNLQNIPAANGYGGKIRAAFEPQKGNVFISADYSQIELRVLAYLSQDKNLINAFLKGHDIHRETAALLFDVTLDEVTHNQRQIGKRINFSILYGLTPYGLSKDLDIPFKDAKLYIERYFKQYPGVSAWMNGVIEQAKDKGYVTTLWGRRRYVPAIHEKNRMLYEEAKRIAINTVAQGTAAEVMKQGMLNLDAAFKKSFPNSFMLLQIHDELLISTPQENHAACAETVRGLLESVVDWNVPLQVMVRTGENWKEVSK